MKGKKNIFSCLLVQNFCCLFCCKHKHVGHRSTDKYLSVKILCVSAARIRPTAKYDAKHTQLTNIIRLFREGEFSGWAVLENVAKASIFAVMLVMAIANITAILCVDAGVYSISNFHSRHAVRFTEEDATQLRYRLWHLANKATSLPAVGKLTVQEQIKMLRAEYGIARNTFLKDCYVRQDDTHYIPENRMQAYASFYNVTEALLRNYKPEPRPSLIALVQKQERQNSSLPHELPMSAIHHAHAA